MKTNSRNPLRKLLLMILYMYGMLHVSPTSAQSGIIAGLDSVEAIYNIKYEMPEGFNNLNTVQIWKPVMNGDSGCFYWVFESKDKQCKVLYRLFPSDFATIEQRISIDKKIWYNNGNWNYNDQRMLNWLRSYTKESYGYELEDHYIKVKD